MHTVQRTLSSLALAALLGTASLAHAQAASAVDGEKQKLIDQILTLWHPENTVLMAIQRPAAAVMEQSRAAMQQKQVPQAKGEATLKDISTDVQKYIDTAGAAATKSAKKAIPTAVVPLLAQNFSVDELKQLLALLQSPVKAKFEKLVPQVDQALGQKVQDDVGAEINKDIQAMNAAATPKLRAALAAPAASGAK